jgi:hypothetical protein
MHITGRRFVVTGGASLLVMVPPMPRARAASSRFCTAGMTEPMGPLPLAVAQTRITTGTWPISSASRMAGQ